MGVPTRRPLRTMARGRPGDDEEVVCRLCGRYFQAITGPHLMRVHGWDSEHPVYEYKSRFRLKRCESRGTGRKRKRSRRRFIERSGKHWPRNRVIAEIRWMANRRRPLNHAAVRHSGRQPLTKAGKKLFGSWDKALRAAGLDPEEVRLQRHWTEEKVLNALRGLGEFVGSHRINRRDQLGMPLLGSRLVDDDGVDLIGQWIDAGAR